MNWKGIAGRIAAVMAVLIVVGLFVVFVWPTRYRYDHVRINKHGTFPIRTDRLTGNTQMFIPNKGWVAR